MTFFESSSPRPCLTFKKQEKGRFWLSFYRRHFLCGFFVPVGCLGYLTKCQIFRSWRVNYMSIWLWELKKTSNTLLPISRIRDIPLTWIILARVYAYLPSFTSQILDFVYWTVLIFILIYFEWRDTENQQYPKEIQSLYQWIDQNKWSLKIKITLLFLADLS